MLTKTCRKQPIFHECGCWSLVIPHHLQRRPSQRTRGDPPAVVYAWVTRLKRKALVTFNSTLVWACIMPRCINRYPPIPYVHVPWNGESRLEVAQWREASSALIANRPRGTHIRAQPGCASKNLSTDTSRMPPSTAWQCTGLGNAGPFFG